MHFKIQIPVAYPNSDLIILKLGLGNYVFFFFNWRIITSQYYDGFFAIHQYELAIGNFYPESSFHLPPHSIASGCHRALVLGALYLTSNYHRLSILHMVMYMFQGYSLKSSHSTLPLRTKSILYVCVSFAALKTPCDLISKQHEVTLFFVGLTGFISLLSERLSRVFFNTAIQKHQFFGAQPSLWSKCHIHT